MKRRIVGSCDTQRHWWNGNTDVKLNSPNPTLKEDLTMMMATTQRKKRTTTMAMKMK